MPAASLPHRLMTTADQNERVLAAVAYVFTFLSGLVVLFAAGKHQHYARWNAVQAVALGVASFVLGWLFALLTPFFFGGLLLDGSGPPTWLAFGGLGAVVGLATMVLIILGAIRAYQGRPLRIPALAALADRHGRNR